MKEWVCGRRRIIPSATHTLSLTLTPHRHPPPPLKAYIKTHLLSPSFTPTALYFSWARPQVLNHSAWNSPIILRIWCNMKLCPTMLIRMTSISETTHGSEHFQLVRILIIRSGVTVIFIMYRFAEGSEASFPFVKLWKLWVPKNWFIVFRTRSSFSLVTRNVVLENSANGMAIVILLYVVFHFIGKYKSW